ncbi:uncharacterized protein E0L32_011632 [Thyridium curvatum]|uniref:Uncharacterized protein n=1 Tax=Thyridium curvatum TaxID=1093900 RepID=A0A507BEP9_9PEZI|nr:uncharacterized protein E0L32_011632 [Thyridium curvatum]TPX18447.1 hypothetical protein E0L32_011632 [Thyridium curvatum]
MGFPKLTPAFTAHVVIDAPSPVGSTKAAGLVHVPFIPGLGTFKSEPSYALQLDGQIEHGADYITVDPNGTRARLDVNSLVRDKATGAFVRVNYQGVIDLTSPAGKVLGGAADAKTTDFGDAFTSWQLQSGDEKLKALEDKVFVGAGRFILEQGKPVIVEYKISEVTV